MSIAECVPFIDELDLFIFLFYLIMFIYHVWSGEFWCSFDLDLTEA